MRSNYNLSVIESIRTLYDYGYNEAPIQLKIVLKALARTVKVCSYTQFSIKHELSVEEVCEMFDSELGVCAYDHKREKYVIYYNDTKMNVGLTRFTIAHELGHIILQHHRRADTDILLRAGISAGVYKAFENEANCFARNFLSPYPLAKLLANSRDLYFVADMAEAFNISYDAASTRIKFLPTDRPFIKQNYLSFFSHFKMRFGYYCTTCKNEEIGPLQYCKICGEKETVVFKGVDRMIYNDGVKTDENFRVLECPKCKNEEFSNDAEYCRVCGTKAYNYCSGEPEYDYHGNVINTLFHKNPSNARFCETCGNKTEFFEKKLLISWEAYQKEIADMLGLEADEFPF